MVKRTMKTLPKSVLMFIALWLSGCAHVPPSLISTDGSPVDDLSKVALIAEDADHPLVLRGVDGIPLETMRVPNAFSKYAYVMKAGPHIFWVRDVPYGHPVVALFERVHCYVMEVELAQGMQYRLREDGERRKALLLNEVTGETAAIGRLVDEPRIPSRGCQWR